MVKEVEFLTLRELDSRGLLARQCAELYCRVWQEPPWNELFWTPDVVQGMLSQELCRPDASCVLALERIAGIPNIIGFSWGYNVDKENLAVIAGNRQLDSLFENEDASRVFYVDELGVDPGKRLKGVGRKLSEMLLAHARKQGHSRAVLRTDAGALPARALYAHLGFTELAVKDSRHESRTYWLLNL